MATMLPALDDTLGALLLGTCISLITHDQVALVLVYTCYTGLIKGYSQPDILLYTSQLTNVRSYPSLSFFAWRVWRVAPKLRVIVVIAGALCMGELSKNDIFFHSNRH
ncbi:hypothetical protein GY45DRAFT_1339483 [Cubamyces sp. BRFM 1775]|nr:hypothetical protein GY45DRAFT_1339483 [Cubamyces sp. BRFM 1775]